MLPITCTSHDTGNKKAKIGILNIPNIKKKANRAGVMAQVVELLPSKCEVLSSSSTTAERKKKKRLKE
jgi:hypothetical protein